MKVKVSKNINDLTRDELKEVFNSCAEDVYYSTGEGLDWFNASNHMKAIKKELKRRKIKLDPFIDEIKLDLQSGRL